MKTNLAHTDIDYIVVGFGLAGMAFCEVLQQHNKSFVVIDESTSKGSSQVAGGMYNPVILKRFTLAWNADEQLAKARPFYKAIEDRLQVKIDQSMSVLRVFHSVQEQNNWFEAIDKPKLSPFLSDKIVPDNNASVSAPLGYGEVLQTGRIDVALLLSAYKKSLQQSGCILNEIFEYDKLTANESVRYKHLRAKHLVFAEGFGLKNNPFFKELPLVGNKGELLTIHAPQLQLDAVVKSSVFVIPLGDDLYKVGATYHWTDKTTVPTQEAKDELSVKLKKLINCPFKIVDQEAGVRPTVIDRRPLVGRHAEYKSLTVLNGLGTRGVLIAPYVAPLLFHHLEENVALPKEISIVRFLDKD